MEMIPEMILAFYDKKNRSGVKLDQVRDKVDYDCDFESLKEEFVPPEDVIFLGNKRFTFAWYKQQLKILETMNPVKELDLQGIQYLFKEMASESQKTLLKELKSFLVLVIYYILDDSDYDEENFESIYGSFTKIQEILKNDEDLKKILSSHLSEFYQEAIKSWIKEFEEIPEVCPVSADDFLDLSCEETITKISSAMLRLN